MTHAVSVAGVSKRYVLHHSAHPTYETLREALSEGVRAQLRRVLRGARPAARLEEEFWALKDVSFALRQGQRLGIIGRNGAGKSTLLKLLSRITEPTKGKIEIRGRVASLLEVGTGFHPELTGRENIYLNGAILGMSARDIRRRFDDIVEFAEIARFLDTPVKRYSSGMYVRLAFSVAAHLEPDILVVDEVLAVGDAKFQRKCLGRMESVGKEGRTVVFVSHNLSAVENLCPESMLLESGMNIAIGSSRDVIRKYLQTLEDDIGISAKDRKDRSGKGNIRVVDIRFPNSRAGNQYAIGDDIHVEIDVLSKYDPDTNARLSIGIYTGQDVPLISCDSLLTGEMHRIPGRCISTLACRISAPPLSLGEYNLSFAVFNSDDEPEDWISSLSKFSMSAGAFEGRSANNRFPVLTRFEWQVHARGNQ
jgi:lipopolysaccharide transport system ATP-binding protein